MTDIKPKLTSTQVNIKPSAKRKLRRLAKADNRSMSNMLDVIIDFYDNFKKAKS